jgi:hypothetical protein
VTRPKFEPHTSRIQVYRVDSRPNFIPNHVTPQEKILNYFNKISQLSKNDRNCLFIVRMIQAPLRLFGTKWKNALKILAFVSDSACSNQLYAISMNAPKAGTHELKI